MHNTSTNRNLVLRALKPEDLSSRDSCLTTNELGLALLKAGAQILPDIESVLTETVFQNFAEQNQREAEPPGLTYVLGAYLTIGTREEPYRALAFLRQMPEPLLIRTLRIIPIFFGTPKGSDFVFVNPPDELIVLLRQLALHDCESIRGTASLVLTKLGK